MIDICTVESSDKVLTGFYLNVQWMSKKPANTISFPT